MKRVPNWKTHLVHNEKWIIKLELVSSRVTWNILFCGNVTSLANILPKIASWGFVSFTSSCHKKSFSVRKYPMENISYNNKLSSASRIYFLPQNILSCLKKLLLFTRTHCFLLEIDNYFCRWFPVALFTWEKNFL